MQEHKNRIVWEKDHERVKSIYKVTTDFSKYETFDITSQIRRAAVSVPTNIVAGSGRATTPDSLA